MFSVSLIRYVIILFLVIYQFWYNKSQNDRVFRGFTIVLPSEVKKWIKSTAELSEKKTDFETNNYKYFKAHGIGIGGTFESLWQPVLYVTDLSLAKKLMVEDAEYFVDRRLLYEPKINPLFSMMLSFAQGQEWKRLRSILSPVFTPSRMKEINYIFVQKCQTLLAVLGDEVSQVGSKGKRINIHETIGRFTMDVISSVAFGIEAESQTKDDSIFYKMGTKVQKITIKIVFIRIMAKYFPKLAEFFKLSTFDTSALEFFAFTTKSVATSRTNSENRVKRKDLLQILLDNTKGILSKDQITSQAVLFYILGFDTMNTLLEICCVLLAQNQCVQNKLRLEVERVCKSHAGVLTVTYDCLNELHYMDNVISETLRLYPPSARTERRCTKTYKIPHTELTINVDTQIVIPIHAFQTDANYWENPLDFIPDRSYELNYFPFGEGPRSCLGKRFALILAKTALAHIVGSYEIFVDSDKRSNIIQQRVGTFKVAEGTCLIFKPIIHESK